MEILSEDWEDAIVLTGLQLPDQYATDRTPTTWVPQG